LLAGEEIMQAEQVCEELRVRVELGFGAGEAQQLRDLIAGAHPQRVLVDLTAIHGLDDAVLFALAEALRGPASPPVTFRGANHHQARVFAYCMGPTRQ
jgi:hypothetical protein